MFHIVDDEDDIREILVELVRELGYQTQDFGCPLDYLEYAASDVFEQPHALLTDVQMPKMNGYEMLDKLSKIRPEVRTAVISGYAKYEGEAKVRSCAFLVKPVDIDRLARLLESFVQCALVGPKANSNDCAVQMDDLGVARIGWSCPNGSRCEGC